MTISYCSLRHVIGFVMGYGLKFQHLCRTNSAGPEKYTECAPGYKLINRTGAEGKGVLGFLGG